MSTEGMTIHGKIRYWWAMATGRELPCTPARAAEMWAEFQRDIEKEDRLFDAYMSLRSRPRPVVMMRETEVSEPRPVESFDMAHWKEWRDRNWEA